MKDELLQREIMEPFRQGDPIAFESIYNSYHYTIYGFAFYYLANQEDAEDIAAETFVKLWNRRANFETLDNVLAFLRITTRNACLDQLKLQKNKSARLNEFNYVMTQSDTEAFAIDEIKNEVLKWIHHEIEKLPKKSRTVMQLSLKGLRNAEIAQQLNVSIQIIMNQKSHALKVIRSAALIKRWMLLFLLLETKE